MNLPLRYQTNQLLSYAEYGDQNGYPILIQHGLIASITDAHLFKQLIDLRTRPICIARPGYGESSPYEMSNLAEWGDIVAILVDALRLQEFDVLGISSGAPYSYAIGHRFPEQTRNIFILSGTPALFDHQVLSQWPYPVNRAASIAELRQLAFELFFAHLSAQERASNDIQDSMKNSCFGIAQDFRLRCMDWGFKLSDVKTKVIMRHSRSDGSVPLITAELTSKMLPNCQLEIHEKDDHFSEDILDDFILTAMAGYYRKIL